MCNLSWFLSEDPVEVPSLADGDCEHSSDLTGEIRTGVDLFFAATGILMLKYDIVLSRDIKTPIDMQDKVVERDRTQSSGELMNGIRSIKEGAKLNRQPLLSN